MTVTTLFCTFAVNGQTYGIEAAGVQELLRSQAMTRVPLAPPVISGLINLRGQIVIAVDMRRRLSLPPRAAEDVPMNVVVRHDGAAVSLVVDAIGDVVEVDDAAFEPPPETLQGPGRELIRGVYKLDERLLLALDVARVVQLAAPARLS